ncbi:hypothetical protein GYMLUDRAFT_183433 [Collybiopsis luxurians FD-317 M1]|uniref:Uncharacterized protein n=1 Tax=Collybiopsis luxurians FD-317 M1 TaxID=944289 RepID=A0A0D0BWG2_9AGAR|nr:hypothetical protein GYMLUDRAFT_183433 [Collybiopsis luxurians FD-317 M1]
MKSLQTSHYLLYGCQSLTVATDAKYIKGILDNSSCGLNTTINRWIEEVRKYHFDLVHIKRKLHELADGLSQQAANAISTPILRTEEEYDQ